jgi:TRAP-type C4-dicarboxylate transport system permease small subunit
MEAFEKLFTAAVARWIRVAAFAATAAFSGLLALLGYLYLFAPADGFYYIGSVFSEQTQVPDWIAGLPVPLGFGIAAIRFAAAAISSATGGTYGAPPVDETLEQAEKAKAEMEGAPLAEADAEAKR